MNCHKTAPAPFELRCHSCSHWLGDADIAMVVAGMFRPGSFGEIEIREHQVRKMCRRCRFMHIFEPASHRIARSRGDEIELKHRGGQRRRAA